MKFDFTALVKAIGMGTLLQELLYVLIMGLIYVYSASFGFVEFASKSDYAWVQFGMILTWGIIDAIILYGIGLGD